MKSAILIGIVALGCMESPAAVPMTGELAFKAAGNEFTFDTGVLRGKLRAGGKANGLSSVVHIPSGTRLDASLGLFSHYRVFTVGKRYGTAAWDWPAESKLNPDGSVLTRWAAASDRPFELRAAYRWSAPNTLDLLTEVQPKADLPGFEVFLACYFSAGFTNALVYTDPTQPKFTPALPESGTWQAFPRDDQASALIKDGRWKLEPNPVDWTVMPRLADLLAIRRAPATKLTGVIMARPEDCFAVCTPHQFESHYSTYLSLFGQDLKAGVAKVARARLLIAAGLKDADALGSYQTFVK
jgi:hypothetical protein